MWTTWFQNEHTVDTVAWTFPPKNLNIHKKKDSQSIQEHVATRAFPPKITSVPIKGQEWEGERRIKSKNI